MGDGDDEGELIMTLAVAGVIFVILLMVILMVVTMLIMGLLMYVSPTAIK
jgi:hypothetical protein